MHWTCEDSVAIFKHFSGFMFFLLPNLVRARPSASNANRWANRKHPKETRRGESFRLASRFHFAAFVHPEQSRRVALVAIQTLRFRWGNAFCGNNKLLDPVGIRLAGAGRVMQCLDGIANLVEEFWGFRSGGLVFHSICFHKVIAKNKNLMYCRCDD